MASKVDRSGHGVQSRASGALFAAWAIALGAACSPSGGSGTGGAATCNPEVLPAMPCTSDGQCGQSVCFCADGSEMGNGLYSYTCVALQCQVSAACPPLCAGHGGLAMACPASSSSSSGVGGGDSAGGSSGSSSGSSSGGSSGSSSGVSGSSSGSSGASIGCSSGGTDFCSCTALQSGGGSCNAASLSQPGACCADSSWPSGGGCQCASFECDVNAGGGRDCWYHSGDADHTTSATGAACCLKQGICSCYDASDMAECDGFAAVSSCSASVTPPCTDPATQGESVVSSCD